MTEAARPLPRGYELVREIGAGGCGEVVLARQTSLARLVAIKRIHSYALAGPDALDRFRREAQVLATLDHPTVVRVYDFRRSDADATLVMEYVPGESLADRLERGPMPVAEALVVLRDVAEALRVGSTHGIVHRDIKPGNVFVLPDGHAKLGDFGLARIVTDPSVFRTSTGEVSGTPAYFPPECGSPDQEPDERSDAYSFAVMAYELLTGQLPFTGTDIMAIVAAHYSKPPPPPESVVPGFPAVASAALLTGLAKDPAARLLPTELVDRLSAVPPDAWPEDVAARTPVARRVAPSAPTVLGVPAPGSSPASAPSTTAPVPAPASPLGRKPGSKRPWWVYAGIAAVLAVIAVIVGTQLGSGESASRSLHVTDVTVAIDPPEATGTCPSAHFDFVATLATNGGTGDVRLFWRRPDRVRSDPVGIGVDGGERSVQATLRYDVTGDQPLHGRAVVHVLTPDRIVVKSEPISYTC